MRIPIRSPADAPWYLRPFFRRQRRKYGAVLDSGPLWARSPPLFVGVATPYGMIDRRGSPIEPALRSLLTVRDAMIARLKRHFDDDAVVELTGLVAFQNLSSKFNSALGVAPQGFCRLPTPAAPDSPSREHDGAHDRRLAANA